MQAIDAAVWMVAQTTFNVPRIDPSRFAENLARGATAHGTSSLHFILLLLALCF
jgi:hypothetical protein